MVAGKHKSRSLRRVPRRVPGGRIVMHYKRRTPGVAQCGGCGANLKGIPRATTTEIRNMPKTARRPQRPFGGVLCTQCARKNHVTRARKIVLS